jgi:hypothetical protein
MAEEKSATELTQEYIKEHPYIKNCLKKILINYSSLARFIGKELGIEKKTSKEAILIAARRFSENLKKEISNENKIKEIFSKSEIEIKNKMTVFIAEKSLDFDTLDFIQKTVRKESGTFYLLEGSDSYIIITQEKYSSLIKEKLKSKIIKKNEDLSLINFKSPKEIEETSGVISYLASLFSENNTNIIELFSCWTDTLFVIQTKDINRALEFLKF